MAMSIPPGLKPVTQYVRRAEKLDRAPEPEAPVVAYYCRLYATEQAMKLEDNSEGGKKFLMSMIGRLEEDKKKGMSQFSKEEGEQMTRDWAMKQFNTADEEDRAGLADQETARGFYAAGVFFDVLRQFGETGEEMDRRRIYCKWKASQILKAIKEGRTPTPGGAGEDVSTGMPSAGGGGVGGAPAVGGGGATAGEQQPYQPPPVEESNRNDPLSGMIPEAPTDNPCLPTAATDGTSTPPASYTPSHDTTYPGGPTGGHAQPPYSTPEPASAPYAPVTPTPAPYVPPAPAPAPYVPPAPAPAPYIPPAPAPAPYVPPAAPASAPVAPRPQYSPTPARPKTPVPAASGSRRSGGGSRPMEGNMADAMEHCRYAIRALEHKNVELAVQKLHEALQQIA